MGNNVADKKLTNNTEVMPTSGAVKCSIIHWMVDSIIFPL
jgi:hypothetical protein